MILESKAMEKAILFENDLSNLDVGGHSLDFNPEILSNVLVILFRSPAKVH